MGALIAARCNRALQAFEQRLADAGKPKLVAIIAVARKLLTSSLVRLSRRSELRLGSVSKRAFPPLNAVPRDGKSWRVVERELAHANAQICWPPEVRAGWACQGRTRREREREYARLEAAGRPGQHFYQKITLASRDSRSALLPHGRVQAPAGPRGGPAPATRAR